MMDNVEKFLEYLETNYVDSDFLEHKVMKEIIRIQHEALQILEKGNTLLPRSTARMALIKTNALAGEVVKKSDKG